MGGGTRRESDDLSLPLLIIHLPQYLVKLICCSGGPKLSSTPPTANTTIDSILRKQLHFSPNTVQHLHPCSSSHGCASSGLVDFSVDSNFPLLQKLVHSPTLLRLDSTCRTVVIFKYVISSDAYLFSVSLSASFVLHFSSGA